MKTIYEIDWLSFVTDRPSKENNPYPWYWCTKCGKWVITKEHLTVCRGTAIDTLAKGRVLH